MGAVAIAPYRNFFRADTLKSLELYEPALSELKEALRVSPTYGAAYHLLGQIYMKLGRDEEAFHAMRIAASLFPDQLQVRLDFADCYLKLKAYDEALKEALQFVGRWPNDLNGRYLLAEIYIAQDDFENVLKEIDGIMALGPKSAEDLLILGGQAMEKKEYDTAELILTAALATQDREGEVHQRLSELFAQVGDEERSRYHRQQADAQPLPESETQAH
jgi:superkiller protein 3